MEEVSDYGENEHEGDAAEKMDQAETLRAGLASINNDIRDLEQELRNVKRISHIRQHTMYIQEYIFFKYKFG